MNIYIQEIHYVINNEERAIKNTLGDPPAAGLLEHRVILSLWLG
jgi:hypothetical protein